MQRYPVTEIGPGLLGLRGNEESIRKVGATVVVQRPGLLSAAERKIAPVCLIRGDSVEASSSKDTRPIQPGERFYVHSIYVGMDVVEFGLMGAQPQTAAGGGRAWGKIAFLFPPEVLHNADRATVFRTLDLWLGMEGASSIAAPPMYTAPPSAQQIGPAPSAATATIRIEPGMNQQQVIDLLGAPVRHVSYEKRAWMIYAGFVVQLENDVVKTMGDTNRPSRVRVRSEPEGAEIYIGEKLVGATPSSLELSAGRYVFIFRLNGHKPARLEVDVLPGGDITVAAKMEK